MIFNSFEFIVFLIVVFVLYWSLFKRTSVLQNILLLAASYFFYGWWNIKLLILFILLITFTFVIGIFLFKTNNDSKRKQLLYLHVLFSIIVLCFFKYYNFFCSSFINGQRDPLNYCARIIFPLGISFYTFKNLSYILDIYKCKIQPNRGYLNYSLYIAFFPCIISGPIEKPKHFFDQISSKRSLTSATFFEGINLILLGYFKKVIIADSIANFVDTIFNNSTQFKSIYVLFGVFLYAFQIYTDFSGYSDIAKGVAKIFGINIISNFNFPFFSKNIAEFWRRWHISLSTWLNDYVFNPLAIAFRNLGKHGIFLAIIFTFIISGIWHGEGATFLIWGLLHALYYSPIVYSEESLSGIIIKNEKSSLMNIKILPKILLNFVLVSFALIFFKAASVHQAFTIISQICTLDNHNMVTPFFNEYQLIKGNIGIFILLIYEFIVYNKYERRLLNFFKPIPLSLRFYIKMIFYFSIIWVLILWGGEGSKSFIYVQF